MRTWKLTAASLLLATMGTRAAAAEPAPPGQTHDTGWKGAGKVHLEGLPSKPGPHIEQIKALGDNQWIKLPETAGDPNFNPPRKGYTRSWGPKACYAPEFGGAFLTGEGGHSWADKNYQRYGDDVVFYDLYANRWIYLYPGTYLPGLKEKIENGEYKVDPKLGVLLDKNGDPMPVCTITGHAGHALSYDSAARKFLWTGGGFGYFFFHDSKKAFQEKLQEKGFKNAMAINPVPWGLWAYDVRTGRIERPDVAACPDRPSFLQYVDSKKMHVWGGLRPPQKADVWWLDMAASPPAIRMEPLGRVRPAQGIQWSACYDPKRDRIYVGGGVSGVKTPEENFSYFDVKNNAWVKPNPKGECPITWSFSSAYVAYDTVNDRLEIFMINHAAKNGEERIHVYDPDKNEFEAPIPVGGVLPRGVGHGFFCPELNAHIIQMAKTDNGIPDTWAWRYKRAPAGKK